MNLDAHSPQDRGVDHAATPTADHGASERGPGAPFPSLSALPRHVLRCATLVLLLLHHGPADRHALAQVVVGGAPGFGPAQVLTGPNFAIPPDLGRAAGDNLFHSFQVFNVLTGESATFEVPLRFANVISRVTGDGAGPSPSLIDGLLKSTGRADFYFINPAGITFGPNARVDVPAAFHVSTADELRLEDGSVFSAGNPTDSSLSMAPPEAFGFLSGSPGAITVERSQLTDFEPEAVLTLAGGDVSLKGGYSGHAHIAVAGGAIRIVAAGTATGALMLSDASMQQAPTGRIRAEGLGYLEDWRVRVDAGGATGPRSVSLAGGEIQLRNAVVSADNTGDLDATGQIRLAAETVSVTNADIRAAVGAAGRGSSISVESDALTIATNFDAFNGRSRISTRVQPGATGRAGDVLIESARVELTDGGQISSWVEDGGRGAGGDVLIEVSERLDASGYTFNDSGGLVRSGVLTTVDSYEGGSGGSIDIQAPAPGATVMLSNGARLQAGSWSALDTGRSGAITVTAGQVELRDGVQVTTTSFGPGDAGAIRLTATGSIALSSSAYVSADARAEGRGGDITLDASGSISVEDDGWVNNKTATGSSGDAGDIHIKAGTDVVFRDSSWIESETRGTGDAGDILIEAGGGIRFENDGYVNSASRSSGAGGSIRLLAGGDIALTNTEDYAGDPTFVDSRARSTGDAGSIRLEAGGDISIDTGARVLAETESTAHGSIAGAGGDIALIAGGALSLRDARVSTRSPVDGTLDLVPFGAPGSIQVEARRVTLTDAAIETSSGNLADAGDISIQAKEHILVTTTDGDAEGIKSENRFRFGAALPLSGLPPAGRSGGIRLDAPEIDIANGAVVSVSTASGDGGEIKVTGSHLSLIDGGSINTQTSGPGRGGTLSVELTGDLTAGGSFDGFFEAGIYSETLPNTVLPDIPSGDGGTVGITADRVVVAEHAQFGTSSLSAGDAGDISISARMIEVLGGGEIQAIASAGGDGGDITLAANELVRISGAARNGTGEPSLVSANVGSAYDAVGGLVAISAPVTEIFDRGAVSANPTSLATGGTSGRVSIVTGQLGVSGGGQVTTTTFGAVDGGPIDIVARSATISGADSAILSESRGAATGSGGDISVRVERDLTLADAAGIAASTDTSGDAGSITLQAARLTARGSGTRIASEAGAGATGAAGQVLIRANDLLLEQQARVSILAAQAEGPDPSAMRPGGITIQGASASLASGAAIVATSTGVAGAGRIGIAVDRLALSGGAVIESAAAGSGAAGRIEILGLTGLALDASRISAATSGTGAGGTLRISATALNARGGSVIGSDTTGPGNAGRIELDVPGTLALHGSSIRAETSASGNAGSLAIRAGALAASGAASILSGTSADGDAGDIRIEAGTIALQGAEIAANTSGAGAGGALDLLGGDLAAGAGARIRTDSSGGGAAGDIRLLLSGTLALDQAHVQASASGTGAAGRIEIETGRLALANTGAINSGTSGAGPAGEIDLRVAGTAALTSGAEISTSTSGAGDAGRILLSADALLLDNAAVASRALRGAGGLAGDVAIRARRVALHNGAQISTASDQWPAAARLAGARGGAISVTADELLLNSPASITASSTGNVPAGAIDLVGGTIRLADESSVRTTSVNADGGPIGIRADALWLQDARITTSVLGSGGRGGDITIETGLLGLDGGFIQANTAGTGVRGGNVNIRADRVIASHGLVFVGGFEQIPFQPYTGLNVIQAAAPFGVNGIVQTNVPDFDVTRTLPSLAPPLGDPNALIASQCRPQPGAAMSSLLRRSTVAPGPAEAVSSVSFGGVRLDRLLARHGAG